jgi:hypothetical protein
MKLKPAPILLLAVAAGLLFNAGCASDAASDAGTGLVGGAVTGPTDAHCEGLTPVAVDAATCHDAPAPDGEGGAPGEASDAAAAGASDCNATHDAGYGETLPNREGDDDDCKYHASWASTPIRLNEDVTFTVTATDLTTNKPLEALDDGQLPLTRVEVYQPCKPTRRAPAQDFNTKFKETAPGVYAGGPFRFDQSGRWVVRFHFYEQCQDGESSPHGHIAFFIEVP